MIVGKTVKQLDREEIGTVVAVNDTFELLVQLEDGRLQNWFYAWCKVVAADTSRPPATRIPSNGVPA